MGTYTPGLRMSADQAAMTIILNRPPAVLHDRAPDDVTRTFNRLFPPEKPEPVDEGFGG